jgi:hypothetical protein
VTPADAPFAELVQLSRTSIADEMREEHRRRACWANPTVHGGGKRRAGIRRQHAELALAFGVGAPENYDETFFLFDCALGLSNCGR